jgi:hypothetical protein
MLPWLKHKHETGLIVEKRKPDGNLQESHSEGNEDSALKQCSADLIRALTDKDEDAVASALRSAFEILDSEPHEEGPHTNEEDTE